MRKLLLLLLVGVIADIAAGQSAGAHDPRCPFQAGQMVGNSYIYVGAFNETECIDLCLHKKNTTHPNINAITMRNSDNRCWCGIHTHGTSGSASFKTCFLRDPPAAGQNVTTCRPTIDIVFVLDSSGSMGNDYPKAKAFVKAMATKFNITEDGARASVVLFSSSAEISITLGQYTDTMSFNHAVDRIRFINSGTDIQEALEKTEIVLNTGTREGVERLVILLTDGKGCCNPEPVAQRIRRRGISIISIGIGANVNAQQLVKISGAANAFPASSFAVLTSDEFISNLTGLSCKTVYQPAPDGKKYKFHEEEETADQAKTLCEEEGGNLVILDTTESRDHVALTFGSAVMWIGATFNNGSNRWEWNDGQPIEHAEGLSGGNNVCLVAQGGNLNTSACNSNLPYLCQKGASKPTTPVVSLATPSGERIRFKCQFFPKVFAIPTEYEVRWFRSQNGGAPQQIHSETIDDGRNVSYIQNSDAYTNFTFNSEIYCSVRTWYTNQPHDKSAFATSNKFFAGIKFDPPRFEVIETGLPVQMTVTLTVPIICKGGDNRCEITVRFADPGLFFNPCYLTFKHGDSVGTSRLVSVSATADLVDDGRRIITLSPEIIRLNTSDDWNNAVATVGITRVSVTIGRCTSTGDPHIRTFDGVSFDLYRIGQYTMVKSEARQFEVQAWTFKCASVSCNCGLAVRERDDVLVIDMCQKRLSPKVYYQSNKEPQRGTFVEQSNNGRTFIMKFASGAFVKFSARPWGRFYYADITVQIALDDYNKTEGLCGRRDKDGSNDMTDRNGTRYGKCGSQACIKHSESWRVSGTESLFNHRGGNMTCRPAENETSRTFPNGCANPDYRSVDTSVTKGFRKMVFPGQHECDRRRNVSTGDVIVTDPVPTGPGPVVPTDDPGTNPVVPPFPTPSGITEDEAREFCKNSLEMSIIYKVCRRNIGVSFDISGYIEMCVADIQILDSRPAALQSAMAAMRDDCEGVVITDPSTNVTDITDNFCLNDCNGNGNCTKGDCVCFEGFISEDCSVKKDQVPTLVDVSCGPLCDMRTQDCTSVSVTSYDLISGNVQCRFNEAKRYPGGVFMTAPVASMISFSEVKCQLPVAHNNYSHQTYEVSLSNDGTKFSNNSLSIFVYDSKCMSCGESSQTCNGFNSCSLKNNTCMIDGYCYAKGESDPSDPECRECDPARSTSKFVYKRDNIEECKDRGYTVQCDTQHVTAVWDKDMFGASSYEVSLNDPSCNNIQSNTTHFWITSSLEDCGSTHTEEEKVIVQKNTAKVTVVFVIMNAVRRELMYTYRMECDLSRSVNVSTDSYYNATARKVGGYINGTGLSKLNTSLDFYTSSSFKVRAVTPLQVTSYQPIYLGIREWSNNRNLKFVVNQCYATPTKSSSDATRYMFFDMKCPIDPTFHIDSSSQTEFNFQIAAFTFLQLRKSVYIHCKLFICELNSTSSECVQECNLRERKRRSATDGQRPLGEIKVESSEITFVKTKTCKDISCPSNSHCVDLYPAQCRCDEGYALHAKENRCTKEKLLRVQGLHLDEVFISTYSDTSSPDFLRFAARVEPQLLEIFHSLDESIVGVTIIGATEGSVVLDLLLIYADEVTPEQASKSFLSSVTGSKPHPNALKIKREKVPTIFVVEETGGESWVTSNRTLLTIALIVPAAVFLLTMFVVMKLLFRKRQIRQSKAAVNGIDNNAIDGDSIVVEGM